MEDPVYLSDEHVLSRMLASETRQAEDMQSYFENRLQRDFNENDRRELAIWMRDVCQAEECQPDIFPLSMLIVDRFLSFVRTKRTQLQLLGAVALLLASKLRQTSQIPAKYLIYYTQDLITLNELKTWELFVLTTLKWDLALITPVDYLDIYIRKMKLDDDQLISDIEEETLKMINQCCLEFQYSLYPPSMIAWACIVQALETWNLGSEHLNQVTSLKYGPAARGRHQMISTTAVAAANTTATGRTTVPSTEALTTPTPAPPPASTTTSLSNCFEDDLGFGFGFRLGIGLGLDTPFHVDADADFDGISEGGGGSLGGQVSAWNHHRQQTVAFN